MTKMGTRLRDLAIYFSAYGDESGDDEEGCTSAASFIVEYRGAAAVSVTAGE
jgi:hypothetical protein